MMRSARLEAFTDAVIAIVLTIMVLEIKLPEGRPLPALLALDLHACGITVLRVA